ncbi:MAG: hypothetical protein PHG66_06840, partial [Candidatus Colwellbacteria bacterium]|nr:hypothetical protein [Candidatus Colwellbacteria bacterium]
VMIVKDRTEPRKGRGRDIEAPHEFCPCLPCWWLENSGGGCTTQERKGCPDPLPEPSHILSIGGMNRHKANCRRCLVEIKHGKR